MNFTYTTNFKSHPRIVTNVHTELKSSLKTAIRLSRAASKNFWILIPIPAAMLFSGQAAIRTIRPANALKPSNLGKSQMIWATIPENTTN